jgi:ribosomal protein S18 acetylase RimI-like enzyme
MEKPKATYVAVLDENIMGTYYIKANQPGLGSHVCNCGYMVRNSARGKGIGRAMCQHSLSEARKLGFKAMQYNLVVSTNTGAVRLWQDLGFYIIGALPRAFNHREKGLVDAFVMYQWLEEK